MELNLLQLNEKQKEAVMTTDGPVMVMAGAGSGKTRVLTHRIAHLIIDCKVPSGNILAVTFTNKAANEMKERVSQLISSDTKYMWVSTFHSFCARLLRKEAHLLAPFDIRFNIIDEDDSLKIIKELIKELNIDSNFLKASFAKKCISNKKNLSNYAFPLSQRTQLNQLDKAYHERLRNENLFDFDDLILKTIELFKEYPVVLEKYQNLFQYIMVDEFQDTNTPQYDLIRKLGMKHHNVFVVGDQDQSIYSFRGAKIENIELFLNDFIGTKVILLEQNYRSNEHILNAANCVIDKNEFRIKKNLYTMIKGGERPFYYSCESDYEEVMYVIDKIKELRLSGYKNSDFAIIYRANVLSRGFEDALIRFQIPYTIYGGISYFSRKEIKDVLAYIRLILNNDDNYSFKRIYNEPKRRIGPAIFSRLQEIAIKEKISLFKAIDHLIVAGIGYENLLFFKNMISKIADALEDIELEDILDLVIDMTGYKAMLLASGDEGVDRLQNVRDLKTVLVESDEFYQGTNREKLEAMLSDIALKTDTDNQKEENDVVKLMTYHQAKGLEFKVVFMIAMEEGIFPSINSITPSEKEEERRICYVGITRAKERLYLTRTESRRLYGQLISGRPSVFIKDIDNDRLNLVKQRNTLEVKRAKKEVKSIVEVEEVADYTYEVGDKVNHKMFGDGLVIAADAGIITVAFKAPYGIKKLSPSHSSIRRL